MGKENILLVDDEEMVRLSMSRILESLGFAITICRNGLEAVEYYKDNWKNVDLVIMDMIMPIMNGKDAVKSMKKINPGLKAIILSGYSADFDYRDSEESGIMGMVEKPFSKEHLTAKITEILEA